MTKDEQELKKDSTSKIPAPWKDTLRTIWNSKMRFLAIMTMIMLGTMIYIGLVSTGPNMRKAMDRPLDELKRENLRITSPLGIYDEDKEIIEGLDGVKDVDYVYYGDFYVEDSTSTVIRVQSLTETIAPPRIVEGRAPEKDNEILLDTLMLEETDYKIGDTITIRPNDNDEGVTDETSEESSDEINVEMENPFQEDRLKREEFTIVGFADHIYYFVESSRGGTTMGDGEINYFGIVQPSVFDKTRPSMAILTMDALQGMVTSDNDYKQEEQKLVNEIQALFLDRPAEIKADLQGDAQNEIDKGRQEIEDGWQELADAEEDIKTGEQELADGRKEYEEGLETFNTEIADAEQKLADGQADLDVAYQELNDGESEYSSGLAEYNDGVAELESSRTLLDDSWNTLSDGQAQLDQARSDLEAQGITWDFVTSTESNLADQQAQVDEQRDRVRSGYDLLPEIWQELIANGEAPEWLLVEVATLEATTEQLDTAQAEIDNGYAQIEQAKAGLQELDSQAEQLSAGWSEYYAGEDAYSQGQAELDDAKAQLDSARQELDNGWAEYNNGVQELEDGRAELEEERANGQAELDDALQEIEDGEQELADGRAELAEERPDAEEKLNEGQQALDDADEEIQNIRVPAYQVLGRYNDYLINTNMESGKNMDALTLLFPTVFYLVAMLTTLTTIGRMVEEERTQIGTLKALGMSNNAIGSKYIAYAVSSSLIGVILGTIFGFLLIMPVIFLAYTDGFDFILPVEYQLSWTWVVIAFLIGTGLSLIAAWGSVSRTLKQKAAVLMRPKPPTKGNRTILEKIPFIWKKLGFMAKVTFRNLTAKKSRMFMTIIGVFGSTALIVMGLGLQSSVSSVVDKQFNILQDYDIEVVFNGDADEENLADLDAFIAQEAVESSRFYQFQGTFENKDGISESFVLYVPLEENFRDFRPIRSRVDDNGFDLSRDVAYITEQMARAIEYDGPQDLPIKDDNGFLYEVPIEGRVEQYVGHNMFMSEDRYQKSFDETPTANTYYLNLEDGADVEAVADELIDMDGVYYAITNEDTMDTISSLIDALGIVVIIIILISTLLTFVVLYNLTNLNVSERKRELSTIKVLGFQNIEVTEYIYRETLILTVLAIILGAIGGKVLHYMITMALSPSNALIDPYLNPWSYVIGTAIVFVFSLIVMFIIHGQLKRVDMVEALKAED